MLSKRLLWLELLFCVDLVGWFIFQNTFPKIRFIGFWLGRVPYGAINRMYNWIRVAELKTFMIKLFLYYFRNKMNKHSLYIIFGILLVLQAYQSNAKRGVMPWCVKCIRSYFRDHNRTASLIIILSLIFPKIIISIN